MLKNKREFLARMLRGLGVLGLLERFARRPGLIVLTYHRIGDPAENPFYDPIFSASPAAFEQQVKLLKERYRLLRLDELIDLTQRGLPLREPAALITFDDGYRDNFDRAFPILRALQAPATLFLVSGWLENPRLPWWDEMAYIFKQTQVQNLELELPRRMSIDLNQVPRPDALWTVIRTFMDDPHCPEGPTLDHLAERAAVQVDSAALGRELFLTPGHVQKLFAAGMDIGSHSHSHPFLSRLSETAQREELGTSRERLTSIVGRDMTALAYPFGENRAFDDRTQQVARSLGYQVAFSALSGLNRPGTTDSLAIRRLNIGHADSALMVRARTALVSGFGRSPI